MDFFPDETFDKKTGEKLASGQMTLVVRGAGDFKGPRKSNHEIPVAAKPNRKPDATCAQKTDRDQVIFSLFFFVFHAADITRNIHGIIVCWERVREKN